ncbi:MAG: hypothetical protein LRY50_04700 [Geovibrio sp.]|nr:hypothetical protein [Geovibrio sp.]
MSYIKERDIYLQTALFLADLKVVRERLEKIVGLSEYIKSVDAILVFYNREGGSNLIFNISSDNPEKDTDSDIVLETIKNGRMTEKTSGSLLTGQAKATMWRPCPRFRGRTEGSGSPDSLPDNF